MGRLVRRGAVVNDPSVSDSVSQDNNVEWALSHIGSAVELKLPHCTLVLDTRAFVVTVRVACPLISHTLVTVQDRTGLGRVVCLVL